MQIQGAVVKEQGQTFAIVSVRRSVLNSSSEAERAIQGFRPVFGGVPVVLMAQDSSGRPTFYGRRDIAQFLSRVPFGAIPWRTYTVN